ncbi:hypothetical protein AWJ20_3636 [Sugiyamaella lignohabitans]|uniref:Uncharacterized protein n=1 Tax=Sugiyamaella lignohabitans TaxID=796027 RepID=A0A170QYP6_9ASCO|nr:uncharacterized protein AWJ20_3636 [Sugiyamaella lignohabitans]ANB15987.1 hypothetical protein AWJ20_3636 [Sugiyamaella lignohabitans]
MPSKSKKRRQNLLAKQELVENNKNAGSTSPNTPVENGSTSVTESRPNGSSGEQKTIVDPEMLKAFTKGRPAEASSTVASTTNNNAVVNGHTQEGGQYTGGAYHDEYDEELDPELTKTSIQRLLSDTRHPVLYDVPDHVNLNPRQALSHPMLSMSRDDYVFRQNLVFRELTGHQSWRHKKEADLDNEAEDELLMKMLEIFIAGQDELTYNEYMEQKYIIDIVEEAAESAARYIIANPTLNAKVRALVINYGKLKAQVAKLQGEFLELSAARSVGDRDREHLQTVLAGEVVKRVRLEHICQGMQNKIEQIQSEAERKLDNVGRELDELHSNAREQEKTLDQALANIEKREAEMKARYEEQEKMLQERFKLREEYLISNFKAKTEELQEAFRTKSESQMELIKSEILELRRQVKQVFNNDIAPLVPYDDGHHSNSANTVLEPPDSTGVPELLDLFLKSTSSAGNSQSSAISSTSEISRQEKLKLLMRKFFEQYAAREKYYKSTIRDKDLQIQIYLIRAKQERASAETERKRAQVLRDEVATSAVSLSKALSALKSYVERFAKLDTLVEKLRKMLDGSFDKITELQGLIKTVSKENLRATAMMSRTEKVLEMTSNIADERDSLKAKVGTLENLCRSLANSKTKLQNDLSVQKALVREMRSQAISAVGNVPSIYNEANDSDKRQVDRTAQIHEELERNLDFISPDEAARKSAEHRHFYDLTNQLRKWDDAHPTQEPRSSTALKAFGFKSFDAMDNFVQSPKGVLGTCGEECPLHGIGSIYRPMWDEYISRLPGFEREDDDSTVGSSSAGSSSHTGHTKRFFGPERPPHMQKTIKKKLPSFLSYNIS